MRQVEIKIEIKEKAEYPVYIDDPVSFFADSTVFSQSEIHPKPQHSTAENINWAEKLNSSLIKPKAKLAEMPIESLYTEENGLKQLVEMQEKMSHDPQLGNDLILQQKPVSIYIWIGLLLVGLGVVFGLLFSRRFFLFSFGGIIVVLIAYFL